MNVLLWLHRDLRVHDQPAVARAAALGRVLPLFVADSAEWAMPAASARQWEFLAETLAFARMQFAAVGAPLAVRAGDAAAILSHMVARHRIARIVSMTPPPPALRASAGIGWEVVPGEDRVAAEIPGLLPVEGVEPGPIPPARALRLIADRCPFRQSGGDPATLLEGAGARPRDGATVAAMERAASRLSGHLAWGTVSAAQVAALPRLRRGIGLRSAAHAAGGACAMHAAQGDTLTAAWSAGETGLPFADACLRYLAATGWLPAALRAMVLSVAVHHLGAGTQSATAALARLSTDYDPQLLAAGLANVMTRRPADPVAMGCRLDPDGRFTRRWLPELAPVPDAMLQMPWRWQGAATLLGRRYPEPLADPASVLRAFAAARPVMHPPQPRRPRLVPGQYLLDLPGMSDGEVIETR